VCDQLTHRHQLWQGLCNFSTVTFVLFCTFTICVPIPSPLCFVYKFISSLLFTVYLIALPPLLTLFSFSTFTSLFLFSNFDLFPAISTAFSFRPVSAFISFLLSHSPFLVLRHLSSSIPSLHFLLYCLLNHYLLSYYTH